MVKKIISTTFCALMFYSLLLMTVGTSIAAEPGYERFSHPTQVIPTIDGKWTSAEEWTDGNATWIGTEVVFRNTWDDDGDNDMSRWIVEFLTDTTNDPGDYLRFCFDFGSGVDSNDLVLSSRKFEIIGHNDVIYYYGYQAEWEEFDLDYLEWTASLSTSSASSTPHWIYEFQFDKNSFSSSGGFEEPWYLFLQVYDASNPGLHAWPPTDPDTPREWGTQNTSAEAIPEGLTFAVMALLTTVSMLVGYKYFIKWKETKTL